MRKYAERYLKNVVPNYIGQGKETKEILCFSRILGGSASQSSTMCLSFSKTSYWKCIEHWIWETMKIKWLYKANWPGAMMMTFNKVKKCRASLIQRATRHSSLRLRSPHPFAQILIDSLWLLAPAADLDFDRDFQNDSAQQRLILTRVGIFCESSVRIFPQWTIWLMICLLSTKRLLGTVYFPH